MTTKPPIKNDIALLMEGFKTSQPHKVLFSHTPRLTLHQAFTDIAQDLPAGAQVTFYKLDDGIAACVRPLGQPDQDGYEPMLSAQFFPEYDSVIIRRIQAGSSQRHGLGSAMLRSQYPFWQRMGVTSIALRTHGLAEGFYTKLGFTRVDHLPEYDETRALCTMMRLDLTRPDLRAHWSQALAKAPPLEHFAQHRGTKPEKPSP